MVQHTRIPVFGVLYPAPVVATLGVPNICGTESRGQTVLLVLCLFRFDRASSLIQFVR